jgi:hypothetical protein
MTLTIDLIDSGALNLLRDMEHHNLIRVNPPVETAAAPKGSLSERVVSRRVLSHRFAGALRLSAEKYAAFQSALRDGRTEWERDSY